MKSTELRINNLVLVDGKITRVEVIHEPDYGDDGLINNIISEYSGIPLTEEWLLKFGFKKTGRFFMRGDVLILCVMERYFYYYYSTTNDKRTDLKHVHQLQNLYFALTGEELTPD